MVQLLNAVSCRNVVGHFTLFRYMSVKSHRAISTRSKHIHVPIAEGIHVVGHDLHQEPEYSPGS